MNAVSELPDSTNHATTLIFYFCAPELWKNKFLLFKRKKKKVYVLSFISHSTFNLEPERPNNYLSFSLKMEQEYVPYISKGGKFFLNNNACEPWGYATTGCLWNIVRIDWTIDWKFCLKAEVELEQHASKVHVSDPPFYLYRLLENFNTVKVVLSKINFSVFPIAQINQKQRSHNECPPQQVLKTWSSWGHRTSLSLWSEEKDKHRGSSSQYSLLGERKNGHPGILSDNFQPLPIKKKSDEQDIIWFFCAWPQFSPCSIHSCLHTHSFGLSIRS